MTIKTLLPNTLLILSAIWLMQYAWSESPFQFNWSYLLEVYPQYGHAMLKTLELSLPAILFSFLLGIPLALLRRWRAIRAYISLSRNTPLLIQLFFLYYGLPRLGVSLSGMSVALIGLIFTGSAVMAEALRGGLEAVSHGQQEAGLAIGLTPKQVFIYVQLPQALAISAPALTANALFLIKETSIVAAIGITELVFMTKDLIGSDYQTAEALFMLMIGYLILLIPAVLILQWAEKKLRWAAHG